MYKSVRHGMRVRYNECDPLGIVFNANYLVYADIAITELWREHLGGYEQMTEEGLDLAVVEANLRYFKPLKFDDEFETEAKVGHIGRTSMSISFTIEHDGTEMASGSIAYVCVETGAEGSHPIPDAVRTGLTASSAST